MKVAFTLFVALSSISPADQLRVLHARQVLDRVGDSDSDVQVRRYDLAGLADLIIV
jgi:hypothetical protein